MKTKEPPYTEPYVRWCGRTVNKIIIYLLPDSIENVEKMSSRLRNVLRRNGFESLEGVREYPKEYFIKFRNMGQATLQKLY